MMTAHRPAIGALGLLLVALVASAWPLLTWSATLAVFGLPHVLVETRWVDQRFGRRIGTPTVVLVGGLLLAIVGVRVAGVAGVGQPAMLAATELALVAALAAAVVPALVRAGVWEAVVGVVAVVALVFGITRAPVDTLVVLAFLHNTTPVGFLAERLGGAARRRAMMACAVAFLVVPALIATGVMTRVLGGIGVGSTGAGWLGVGTLLDNAAAFVPSFVGSAYTADLFRCAAYLQCLHYAVVLIVLPRLGAGATPGGRVAWPALQPFIVWVAALGVLLSILFAVAFNDARAIYGVFAAVHAWIEIPVLLLALTLLPPVSARWKRTHSPLL